MSAPSSSNRRRLEYRIERVESTTSTMDDVARLASSGADEGLVVVADYQSAGRGRAGRNWVAPPGTALQFSLLLRPDVEPQRLSVLPLLIGVAVAEAIESFGPIECRLKWPNDLLIQERKVGGILMTARSGSAGVEQVIVGIGINVLGDRGALPSGATTIEAESGQSVDLNVLLADVLSRLRNHYDQYLLQHGRLSTDIWLKRAAYIGEWVSVVDRGEDISGRFLGITEDGALLLNNGQSVREVVAGDMSRGPRRSA